MAESNVLFTNRSWFLILGVLLLVLGLAAIGAATLTTFISVIFLGIMIGLAGIFLLVDSFRLRHYLPGFFTHLLLGLLYIVVGVWLVKFPLWGAISLTFILAVFYLVAGLWRSFYALWLRFPHWGWSLFGGLVAITLGLLILFHWPASSLFIIGLFVGIDLLLLGWLYLMLWSGLRT